jgi:lycopene beta-cyclase
VRNAIFIAEQPDLDGDKLNLLLRQRANEHWHKGRFYRMLNRMLFRGADGTDRYKILQRFYKLNPGLIERFYAGNTTIGDMARILTGKPPIPIGRAIKAIRSKKK